MAGPFPEKGKARLQNKGDRDSIFGKIKYMVPVGQPSGNVKSAVDDMSLECK